MKTTLNFNNINKLSTPTWSWLKMNSVSLSLECEKIITEEKLITTKKGEKRTEPVLINFDFKDGSSTSKIQKIDLAQDSELTLILNFTSSALATGFSEIKTKINAAPNSKIHLIKTQLLGKNFVQIDNTEFHCADGAFADFTQIELGGQKVYAQVKTELAGYKSRFNSDTAYIAEKNQLLDMNYESIHTGALTDTKMTVKGTVAGEANKTYRGTIDFKRGCAGATGDEQEETLLLSPNAVNKSIPIILCDEEDVSGTHGATLGRLGEEELFYFESRGISEQQAKQMMKTAKVLAAANLIPDSDTVQRITDFLGL